MNRLEGKVAIVTGGASGIGRAIAEGFAKEGAKVCIADISQEKCDQAAKEIAHGATNSAMGHAVNVCEQASIDALVKAVEAKFGGINILVNSAGVFGMQLVTDITEEEFDRIIGVNTRGLVFMTQAVARSMLSSGQKGSVVSIASGAGRRASPGAAVYSMSKAAVINFTQAAAQELALQGIRVNAIAPGTVDTPMWREQVEPVFADVLGIDVPDAASALVAMTPAGRTSTPADYVGMAIFLASDESDYVVGQTFNVDGGYQLN